MSTKRKDIMKLMKSMNIDPSTFSEEDIKQFEQGQVMMSDSESDSMRDSVSIPDIENYQQNRHNKSGNTHDTVNMKHNYSSVVGLQEKQISFLNAEIKRVQTANDADRQRIFANHRIETDKLLSEIKQLKSKMIYQESQLPGIREALAQVRDMLAGLVPEAVYLRLRDMNEKEMPIQDWVLVQVWEIVYPFKKEGEFQKKEIMALREELRQVTEKHQFLLNDLEHGQKMMVDREEDIRRHKLNYDNARKALELELTKSQEELALLREKGARFDELSRDYKRLEQEKFLLEEKSGFYQNNQAGDKAGDQYKGQDDSKRKGDLLQQDKEYLTKENIQLLEKVKRLEDKLDRTEKEYLEAKNQAQEYLFQLLNSKTDQTQAYEKRIYSEIADLKEKHHHELEIAKQNLVDIYETQIKFLKDAKEEIQLRKDNLEGQVKEKSTLYDHLLIDYRNLQRKLDGDLSEQRIQLRLKVEELDRVQNIYEDTLANLKANKHENEMLREKINVLKAEYYKCQVEAKEQMCSINAQLQVAKEQLTNYEGIEKEIDDAIMKSAGNEYDAMNPLLGFMGTVPTSSKRRIQQALNLAQRLQVKQRESEELQKQLRGKISEIERLQEETKLQRDILDKTHQPHSYLVAHIEEKDREILKYKSLLKKYDQDYQILKAENDDIANRFMRAEEDLQRLRIKRQNLQNIQNILIGIATGSQNDMRQNLRSAINEMSEALNTKTYIDPQSAIQKKSSIQNSQQKNQEGPSWYSKLKQKQNK
ncbi:unnamed protein product [Paramecium pentaurelia]|uniref:Progesterone-induced-blocking factor 1 n=1 Tax=Paramecium pentaurelia TaxID=43138 RepID=A0A8S1TWK8_9CILI|nr:unnamed protein product [Paramecium pentaurelia]